MRPPVLWVWVSSCRSAAESGGMDVIPRRAETKAAPVRYIYFLWCSCSAFAESDQFFFIPMIEVDGARGWVQGCAGAV
jgi:hypothetical protein